MRKKRKTEPMTFARYSVLFNNGCIAQSSIEDLKECGRPEKLGGRYTPETLNNITMGQLAELLTAEEQTLEEVLRVIMGLRVSDVMSDPAQSVHGFMNFVTSEFQRIGGLFKQLEGGYTAEQIQAGVLQLDTGGIFGTIDWYAQRMGITNHDEVLKVPWLHIWQCAKNDKNVALYERRLNKIMLDNAKK